MGASIRKLRPKQKLDMNISMQGVMKSGRSGGNDRDP